MFLRIAANVPWMENYSTVSEKFFIGVTLTLLGVSIVFLVLVLISFMVSVLSRLAGGSRKQAKAPAGAEPAAPAAQPATIQAAPREEPETETTLIAVLAAAIAAYTAESAPHSSAGFIIRRVRRV